MPLAIATWGLILWIAIRFLTPTLRRWSLSRAAMHVEQSQPGMHERLSSAVELAGERDDRFRGSPALLAHLLRQAEKDAKGINPQSLIGTGRVKRWGMYLAPVVLTWMVSLLHPLPVEAGLYRLFNPMAIGLPRRFRRSPSLRVTSHWRREMTCRSPRSSRRKSPATRRENPHAALMMKYASGQTVSTSLDPIRPREFETKLTDLQQGFAYMVRTDAVNSAWFTAVVNPRPAISSLDLRYTFTPNQA